MSVSWQEVAYRFGIEVAVNFFLFRCVRLNISFAQSDIDTVWHYKPPQSPVNSQEFIANGLEGRALGKAIKEAEDAWIAQHFAQYQ